MTTQYIIIAAVLVACVVYGACRTYRALSRPRRRQGAKSDDCSPADNDSPWCDGCTACRHKNEGS